MFEDEKIPKYYGWNTESKGLTTIKNFVLAKIYVVIINIRWYRFQGVAEKNHMIKVGTDIQLVLKKSAVKPRYKV